jgi:hypothetical protein
MEDLFREADQVIAKMSDNFPEYASLVSNDEVQHHRHQGANPNNIRWIQANINTSYEVDFNFLGEVCNAPKRCTNKKLPQACEAATQFTNKNVPQTCVTPSTIDKPTKTGSSFDYKDQNKMEKLVHLVAEKLKPKTPQFSPQAMESIPDKAIRQTSSNARR